MMKYIQRSDNNFQGLCGKPRLLDVGGVPYLVPLPQLDKLYDIKTFPEMCDMTGSDECLVVGAGAAPYTFLDRNAEVLKWKLKQI